MDYEEILKILRKNKNLNFVQRILNKDEYPTMPRPDIEEDAYSTHLMSYATDDKGAFVFPRIIQDQKTGKLKMLEPDEAAKHAMKTNEFIRFEDPNQAEAFSINYKKYWDRQKQIDDMNKGLSK